MLDSTIFDGYGYSLSPAFLLEISTLEELKDAILDLNSKYLRYRVFGRLKNVVFASQRSDIGVLKLSGAIFKKIKREGDILNIGAGVDISELMRFSIDNSIGGLEYMVGIPATIAGAAVGNSGAFGREIFENIVQVECLNTKGELLILNREEIDFKYRSSNLESFILTKVFLKITLGAKAEIKENMRVYIKKRFNTQDARGLSCGCFFKNHPEHKAAILIDSLGLKGYRRGGAVVSDKHANFLISLDNSSSEDILSLKDVLQRRVWKDKRVWLMPEVELIW
ncbi:MAG: UDP-N-acetylmuramate dehydrogenase [Candidatus Kaelpia aquatica]|nr:UDP-N-acetylmuramate dehydrogenase [Candidatus Kaelpia aquatica]